MTHQPDQSRRNFLAAAGAVGAAAVITSLASAKRPDAPVVVKSAAKAKPRAPLAADGVIKIGVIGMGGPGQGSMGMNHCHSIASLIKDGKDKVEIAALCDVNKFNMEYVVKHLPEWGQAAVPATYSNYKELLAREDLHGVLIATPEHWHAQMGVDAILAGKDVYLEKPMTLTLDEALALREVVLANPDMRLQVGTQMTNLPKYHEAKKVIAAGTIGVPTFSQTSYCRNSPKGEWNYYALKPDQKEFPGAEWKPGENVDWDSWCGPLGKQPWDPKLYSRWRRYKKTSTGILGDLLPHVITPLFVSLGDSVGWPTRVVAVGSHLVDKEMENHDSVNIAVQFESGHQMMIAGSTCNQLGLDPLIRGSKGNIRLGSRHCEVSPEPPYTEEVESKKIECPDIGNDQDLHRLKWFKCIRERIQPDSDVIQGAKVMVIVGLATRSMWEGGAFEFDPKTMTARKV